VDGLTHPGLPVGISSRQWLELLRDGTPSRTTSGPSPPGPRTDRTRRVGIRHGRDRPGSGGPSPHRPGPGQLALRPSYATAVNGKCLAGSIPDRYRRGHAPGTPGRRWLAGPCCDGPFWRYLPPTDHRPGVGIARHATRRRDSSGRCGSRPRRSSLVVRPAAGRSSGGESGSTLAVRGRPPGAADGPHRGPGRPASFVAAVGAGKMARDPAVRCFAPSAG